MLKIIHGADFHLDSPFSGLTPERAAQRRGEQRELLDRLAALAREKQADLVLLAGDLLDSDHIFRETAQALREALGNIPCPVFIAPGNHDFYSPRSVWAALDWPDNVHIFSSAALETVELPGCTLWGRAFTDTHQDSCPLEGLTVPDDGKLHIAVLHGEVGQGSGYGPISAMDIAASALDYLALGHVHQGSGLQREGNTCWAYPGCPEGRGFDELGPKGALIVSLGERAGLAAASPDGPSMAPIDLGVQGVAAKFVPVCRRQYRVETVNVNSFMDAVPQGDSPDLVRFLLTGESRLAPDLAALTAQAAPHFFHVELRDRTTLPVDLWARGSEDSLTGLFLREMRARLDGAEEGERDKLLLAARFGLAALEGGEDVRP